MTRDVKNVEVIIRFNVHLCEIEALVTYWKTVEEHIAENPGKYGVEEITAIVDRRKALERLL